jgi:hypothetical protein
MPDARCSGCGHTTDQNELGKAFLLVPDMHPKIMWAMQGGQGFTIEAFTTPPDELFARGLNRENVPCPRCRQAKNWVKKS